MRSFVRKRSIVVKRVFNTTNRIYFHICTNPGIVKSYLLWKWVKTVWWNVWRYFIQYTFKHNRKRLKHWQFYAFAKQDFLAPSNIQAKQNSHSFAFELECHCRIWKTKWTSIGETGQDVVQMDRKVIFPDTGVHRGSGYEVMKPLCFFVLPISEKRAYSPPWWPFTGPRVPHIGLL